jgi:hypothetical protein
MKKHTVPILISLLVALGVTGLSYAADVSTSGAGTPQASGPIDIREPANVTLQSGMSPRRGVSQMVTIGGEQYTAKVPTEQEVRVQRDEQTHMNANPVLAIKSDVTWSFRAGPARSIPPVMRLQRNSREE